MLNNAIWKKTNIVFLIIHMFSLIIIYTLFEVIADI